MKKSRNDIFIREVLIEKFNSDAINLINFKERLYDSVCNKNDISQVFVECITEMVDVELKRLHIDKRSNVYGDVFHMAVSSCLDGFKHFIRNDVYGSKNCYLYFKLLIRRGLYSTA